MKWTPDQIKSLQAQLGLSNAEFADAAGASLHSVEQWRGGHRTPRDLRLKQNLNALREAITGIDDAKRERDKKVYTALLRVYGVTANAHDELMAVYETAKQVAEIGYSMEASRFDALWKAHRLALAAALAALPQKPESELGGAADAPRRRCSSDER